MWLVPAFIDEIYFAPGLSVRTATLHETPALESENK
jgi:hypothetical protein